MLPQSAPDLKLIGFALWVHGYEFPSATDDWDSNWLRVTAHVGASGAEVNATGSILDTVGVNRFAEELRELEKQLKGTATLESHEPNLKVVVAAADRAGHLNISVEITPNHMTQEHRFTFDGDQTFLGPSIRQCESILRRFPVRGAVARGV
jgi:hypothetical protein